MKSMATRKNATEIRLWERSIIGTPDSIVVTLTRPPRWSPSTQESTRMANPMIMATPSASRTG